MIYIKYTWKTDPSYWSIWGCLDDSTLQTMVINNYGNTFAYKWYCNLKKAQINNHIEYLTEEQVDLLKLELL